MNIIDNLPFTFVEGKSKVFLYDRTIALFFNVETNSTYKNDCYKVRLIYNTNSQGQIILSNITDITRLDKFRIDDVALADNDFITPFNYSYDPEDTSKTVYRGFLILHDTEPSSGKYYTASLYDPENDNFILTKSSLRYIDDGGYSTYCYIDSTYFIEGVLRFNTILQSIDTTAGGYKILGMQLCEPGDIGTSHNFVHNNTASESSLPGPYVAYYLNDQIEIHREPLNSEYGSTEYNNHSDQCFIGEDFIYSLRINENKIDYFHLDTDYGYWVNTIELPTDWNNEQSFIFTYRDILYYFPRGNQKSYYVLQNGRWTEMSNKTPWTWKYFNGSNSYLNFMNITFFKDNKFYSFYDNERQIVTPTFTTTSSRISYIKDALTNLKSTLNQKGIIVPNELNYWSPYIDNLNISDTSAATASAEDIRAGKTAYTASGKTLGTMEIPTDTGHQYKEGTFKFNSLQAAINQTLFINLGFRPKTLIIWNKVLGTDLNSALSKTEASSTAIFFPDGITGISKDGKNYIAPSWSYLLNYKVDETSASGIISIKTRFGTRSKTYNNYSPYKYSRGISNLYIVPPIKIASIVSDDLENPTIDTKNILTKVSNDGFYINLKGLDTKKTSSDWIPGFWYGEYEMGYSSGIQNFGGTQFYYIAAT